MTTPEPEPGGTPGDERTVVSDLDMQDHIERTGYHECRRYRTEPGWTPGTPGTERPDAVVLCVVRYYGHKHASGCWGFPKPGVVHHRMVYAEGRDFQCTCGTWGSAEPGYLGYQWHIEGEYEVAAERLSEVKR